MAPKPQTPHQSGSSVGLVGVLLGHVTLIVAELTEQFSVAVVPHGALKAEKLANPATQRTNIMYSV